MREIEFEGKCYVLLQTGETHPIIHYRHDLLWYPERSMTLVETVQYKPFVKSIVTENPWLISNYDREDVFIWEKRVGKWDWQHPNSQTYGASVNKIMMCTLGIHQTIPSTVLDGGKEIQKMLKKLDYSGGHNVK